MRKLALLGCYHGKAFDWSDVCRVKRIVQSDCFISRTSFSRKSSH